MERTMRFFTKTSNKDPEKSISRGKCVKAVQATQKNASFDVYGSKTNTNSSSAKLLITYSKNMKSEKTNLRDRVLSQKLFLYPVFFSMHGAISKLFHVSRKN